ncbi:MAG: 4-alpha-glucanotransferase [bacterium]
MSLGEAVIMKLERSSGILLHPTSLPGKFGIGSLGKEAFEFIDILVTTRQKLWQILPLGPTGYGDSPYQSFSTFAGNPLVIDLEKLVEDGLLSTNELDTQEHFGDKKVDFGKVISFKYPLYRKAFKNFKASCCEAEKLAFDVFCKEQNDLWLDDYSLYASLKDHFKGKQWNEWDEDIKLREAHALNKYREQLTEEREFYKFLQYEFFKQWGAVKKYANSHKIKIVGDIPIFVSIDSSDAWANADLFFFDEKKNPTKVAGVPPDYFSKTGQLWGNPLYDWAKMKKTGYAWWINRIRSVMSTCDVVRIDHFRGFSAYWAVPASNKDAIIGEWEKGPGADFFHALKKALGDIQVIAEDLGVITPDVEKLRDEFGFPGMKILQFAFDPNEESSYIPHRHICNCVIYTGTHDNDTTSGWYQKLTEKEKKYIQEYLDVREEDVTWGLIRAAFASTAKMAIIPMQDVLSLGSNARMNTPGAPSGNWQWRFSKEQLSDTIKDRLKKLTTIYRRNQLTQQDD